MAEIADLLARGGWELDDAQARHRAHPDTFWLPPREQLDTLRPGCTARLIFRLVDQADPLRDRMTPYDERGRPQLAVAHERMWLWVEEREGDELVGILQNLPVSSHTALEPGSRVRFHTRDVIDLDCEPPADMGEELEAMAEVGFPVQPLEASLVPVDAGRRRQVSEEQEAVCAAAGVLPERPDQFSGALVAPSVFEDDAWPLRGGRFPPDPERNHCGWVIYTRHDEFEDAAQAERFQVTHCSHLRETRAWPFLALPPGWAFVAGPDGYQDVYREPSLFED